MEEARAFRPREQRASLQQEPFPQEPQGQHPSEPQHPLQARQAFQPPEQPKKRGQPQQHLRI